MGGQVTDFKHRWSVRQWRTARQVWAKPSVRDVLWLVGYLSTACRDCARIHWHMSCQEELRPRARDPGSLAPVGRTSACDPHGPGWRSVWRPDLWYSETKNRGAGCASNADSTSDEEDEGRPCALVPEWPRSHTVRFKQGRVPPTFACLSVKSRLTPPESSARSAEFPTSLGAMAEKWDKIREWTWGIQRD